VATVVGSAGEKEDKALGLKIERVLVVNFGP
jgi:hypothetical protein